MPMAFHARIYIDSKYVAAPARAPKLESAFDAAPDNYQAVFTLQYVDCFRLRCGNACRAVGWATNQPASRSPHQFILVTSCEQTCAASARRDGVWLSSYDAKLNRNTASA
jgi:hypothetical protein